ncbi:MAG: hypothetical protein OQK12_05485, partial [Motiliproteus sp.]|nr:hypothetical protein [Motiliproteus sp.]
VVNLEASHFATIKAALLVSDNLLFGFKHSWWNLLGLDEVVPLEVTGYDLDTFFAHLFWDERNHNDPASKWLRELIVEISGEEIEAMRKRVSEIQ